MEAVSLQAEKNRKKKENIRILSKLNLAGGGENNGIRAFNSS